ncbi:hypothetical protein Q5530_24000 [Saccharothrix sp. BKS2]|uniref:hypothetical protein n=1 Tax=Saccharothrix sp. BKS2 TaxID=3064400 RepID=UPI0039EBF8E6
MPEQDGDQTSAAAPPVLDLLLHHEEERASARAAGNSALADSALVNVVRDLDTLLDSTENHLRRAGRGLSRAQVRRVAPQLAAMSALPLDDVAEFFGLPPHRVQDVLADLAQRGSLDPDVRARGLLQVQVLRDALHQVVVTRDHSLLDRLLAFVSRFVLLGVVALASAASGALAVDESVVKEVVKTAVVALVAAALQLGAEQVRSRRAEDARRVTARDAHEALLTELAIAGTLWQPPAYEGEHGVLRIRLAVRACVVRVATIPLDWPEKWVYWDVLDDVNAALHAPSPDGLALQLRRLTALPPPT